MNNDRKRVCAKKRQENGAVVFSETITKEKKRKDCYKLLITASRKMDVAVH
jgi:hypothetical protein